MQEVGVFGCVMRDRDYVICGDNRWAKYRARHILCAPDACHYTRIPSDIKFGIGIFLGLLPTVRIARREENGVLKFCEETTKIQNSTRYAISLMIS